MSSDISRMLVNFDQFRVVSRDLTKGTFSGGAFTAIAYAALLLLFIAELGSFLRKNYQTNVLMDQNEDELIQINFDIFMYDLPCKYLKIGVWDKFGEEKMNSSDQFHYIPVDNKGQHKGMAYTKEEISLLEQADTVTDVTDTEKKELDSDWSSSSDHFKHKDFHAAVTFHEFTMVNFFAEWCSHCRKFHPMWNEVADRVNEKMNFKDGEGKEATVKFLKMNCVDFQGKCQEEKIQAFPSLRLYKRDGSFEQFTNKRSVENILEFITTSVKNSHLMTAKHHAMFDQGCQVQGWLNVPRVPGHFSIQAEAHGEVQVNPALVNVSHSIRHLSFGMPDTKTWAERQQIPKDMLKYIQPLDNQNFVAEHFHEAPQHYLKVVSTKVDGQNRVFYQMTHTDRVRKLPKTSDKPTQARFSYDFSPMSVVVKEKSKRWYEFLTSLFAILGGTFTIVELCSGAVDTVGTAVKEAMGKAN